MNNEFYKNDMSVLDRAEVDEMIRKARAEQAEVIFGFFARLVRAVSTGVKTVIVDPIVGAVAAVRATEELSRLSDRELADIGLTRSDIPGHVYRTMVKRRDDHSVVSVTGHVAAAGVGTPSNDRGKSIAA